MNPGNEVNKVGAKWLTFHSYVSGLPIYVRSDEIICVREYQEKRGARGSRLVLANTEALEVSLPPDRVVALLTTSRPSNLTETKFRPASRASSDPPEIRR